MRYFLSLLILFGFLRLGACDEQNIDIIQFFDNGDPHVDVFIKWSKDDFQFEEIENAYLFNLKVSLSMYLKGEQLFQDSFEVNSRLPVPRDLYSKRSYNLIESGDYQLVLSLMQDDGELCTITKDFSFVDNSSNGVFLSDPMLLSSIEKVGGDISGPLIKNGYYLNPLLGFNSRREKELIVHFEAYNETDVKKDLFVQITIKKDNGDYLKSLVKPLGDNSKASFFMPVQTSDIQSGNYQIELSLKEYPKGNLIEQKLRHFYRENPFLNVSQDSILLYLEQEFSAEFDEVELDYCMRAVVPVILQGFSEEWSVIKKKGTLEEKQLALLSYYLQLDHNLYFDRFMEFMKKIEYANHFYESGFGYGFESDRGVIFLKYGQPNDVFLEEHESSAPPYEIWSYNVLEKTGQGNVKFIFYNPSLAPGNFILLHSTANGEINNPRWKLDLYRNSPWDHLSNDINETEVMRNINRNAGKNFQDF